MELCKASPKKEFRSLRSRSYSRSSNLLESFEQVNGNANVVVSQTNENGVVRMKLVVKKQDLKQMLEMVRGCGKTNHHQLVTLSVEHRLNILRRRQVLRVNAAKERPRLTWTPSLQSIPEEF